MATDSKHSNEEYFLNPTILDGCQGKMNKWVYAVQSFLFGMATDELPITHNCIMHIEASSTKSDECP